MQQWKPTKQPQKHNQKETQNVINHAMALFVKAVALLALMSKFQFSLGAVYKVGDSAGWTTIGNIDYKQWAAIKTFQVGDIIQFVYSSQFHNVMRVTHAMYRSCNASVPLEAFSTGNDSYTIKTKGHHFFLCGVPGHCQAGQKVDINVPRNLSSTASPPSGLASPTVPASTTLAPTTSMAAAPLEDFKSRFGMFGVLIAVFAVSVSGVA